jgi:hypothetical protein
MRISILAPAVITSLALLSTAAHAVWQPDGTPQSPFNTPGQSRFFSSARPDGIGGAYMVWEFGEPLPDFSGSHRAIEAQRVDVLGNRPAPWPAQGTTVRSWLDNSSFGTYAISPLPLIDDAAGGAFLPAIDHAFVVEYQNFFRLYHIAPGATVTPVPIPLGGEIPVLDADAAADGTGGVVLIASRQTFSQPPNPVPPSPLFAQRYDANGNPLWPTGSNGGIDLVPAGQQGYGLATVADAYGGGYFAWIDRRDGGDPDLYLQHITLIGTMQFGWPAGGLLVCGAAGDQTTPHLIPDGVGGVFVVWSDERSGTPHVYTQHVDPDGVMGAAVDGNPVPASGPDETFVIAANDSTGGLLLALATGESRLYRLDGDLQVHAGWPADGVLLNSLPPGDGRIGLLPDGLGGAYVSFRNGFGNVAPQGLYAQHYAPDATLAPGWSPGGYRLSGGGQNSGIVGSGPNGAIVVWTDSRNGAAGIYAQRLALDGPVATDLALADATADPTGVSLRWFGTGAEGLAVAVERRTESTDWERLSDLTVDGTGTLRFRDDQVVAGTRYGYRLMVREGGAEHASGEAWIDVPTGLTLAIEPRPNPAAGAARVVLTLPRAGATTLELMDLAGRRVLHRDLSHLGAGRHLVPLDETAGFAPGVYTLRLVQNGEARLTRVCLVR